MIIYHCFLGTLLNAIIGSVYDLVVFSLNNDAHADPASTGDQRRKPVTGRRYDLAFDARPVHPAAWDIHNTMAAGREALLELHVDRHDVLGLQGGRLRYRGFVK